MESHELSPELKEHLTHKLQPYLERLEQLEQSHEQKDAELVILKHAYENVARLLEEQREGLKKNKSSLKRLEARQGADLGRRL